MKELNTSRIPKWFSPDSAKFAALPLACDGLSDVACLLDTKAWPKPARLLDMISADRYWSSTPSPGASKRPTLRGPAMMSWSSWNPQQAS